MHPHITQEVAKTRIEQILREAEQRRRARAVAPPRRSRRRWLRWSTWSRQAASGAPRSPEPYTQRAAPQTASREEHVDPVQIQHLLDA